MRLRSSTKEILSKVVALTIIFSVSPAFARPWTEHTGRLSNLAKQIETKEEEIHGLIVSKRKVHDRKQVSEIMRSIAEAHKSLKQISTEYEEERQHVRFEHPERNDEMERVYVRHHVRTVGEMENEFGLDGRLDRLKTRVFATFPLPPKKQDDQMKRIYTRQPASVEDDEAAPEKIHLKR